MLLDLPNKEYGINRVQDEALAQLAGTNYEVFASLRAIPAMLIYVDAEALAVLERSSRVKQISLNRGFGIP